MEMLEGIFQSLSIDKTLFYQFGIFLLIFVTLHCILFERLQEVIEVREGQTSKLEQAAHAKFADAEKLAAQYDKEIAEANLQVHNAYGEHKRKVVQQEQFRLKKSEEKINIILKEQVEQFGEELEKHKGVLLGSVEDLSGQLVNKFTRQ